MLATRQTNRRPVPGVTAQAACSRHDSPQGTLHFNGDYCEHHRYRASGELARSRNRRLCNLREPSYCRLVAGNAIAGTPMAACGRVAFGMACAFARSLTSPKPARSLALRAWVRQGFRGPCFPPPYSSSALGGEDARGLLREAVASPIFSAASAWRSSAVRRQAASSFSRNIQEPARSEQTPNGAHRSCCTSARFATWRCITASPSTDNCRSPSCRSSSKALPLLGCVQSSRR